ncbi:MAG: acetyl-CoA carboxylase biotin carboxyl carrier protein [Microcoleaceae cyanobacterium]
MQLDLNQLRELLSDIDKTNISELTLKSDDFELTVRKDIPLGDHALQPMSSVLASGVVHPEPVTSISVPTAESSGRMVNSATSSPPSTTPSSNDPKLIEVTSPMVGTFYRSPAPGEPTFVEVGDRIPVGQTVCIIEAMKLMNEIEAEVAGQVVEILIENGAPVEYGQALIRIKPG